MQYKYLKKNHPFCTLIVSIILFSISGIAEGATPKTGSKSQHVHILKLYDENNVQIDPTADNPKPYSAINTCGQCHDYEKIQHGWHFNAAGDVVDKGRPGEPWIMTDDRVGVQLPLSYRGWKGTFNPKDLKVTQWEMIRNFGRHMPGGGIGEKYAEPSEDSKWKAAGNLRIDCLTCHTADRSFDHEAWGQMIKLNNMRWAPTAAAGLGKITGAGTSLPKDADIKEGEEPEIDPARMPKVEYDLRKFDKENKVFFDVVRKPPNNRCFACHTVNEGGVQEQPKWHSDQDVHIRAGFSCVDCHTNGIEHHTVRGFKGEIHPKAPLQAASLSCAGCHLGDESEQPELQDMAGRLGAPKPVHGGIPPFHFDKLSCTVCHSGPMPKDKVGTVQTSMAHALGEVSKTKTTEDMPNIASPVYLKTGDGQVEPHRVMWPAYWGLEKDGEITAIHPDQAYRELRRVFRKRRSSSSDDKEEPAYDGYTPEQITTALETLKNEFKDAGEPVYIAGGKLYKLVAGKDEEGKETMKLDVVENHPASEPYTWAFGHNVRPARQALGVNGCTDCHSKDAPFFYATSASLGPALNDPKTVTAPLLKKNHEWQGWDASLLGMWEQSFAGHKPFKFFAWSVFAILVLVGLRYALRGLGAVLSMSCCKSSKCCAKSE